MESILRNVFYLAFERAKPNADKQASVRFSPEILYKLHRLF